MSRARQLTSYAGYLAADGTVTGDRQNVDLTRTIRSLGYRLPDPPGHFDRLPIVIRDTQDRRILYDLPGDTLREVAIAMPITPASPPSGCAGTRCPASAT